MANFDKRIRELSKDIEIPEEYSKKVDEILESIPEAESPKKRQWINKRIFSVFACILGIGFILYVGTIEAKANIFTEFKQTLMDFFHIAEKDDLEEMGVESNKTYVESKVDLMLELQETVIDKRSIYLLVKITAPSHVEFDKDISFDYFGFFKGENYNADYLIGGATSCSLLEVTSEKPNVANYVISLSSDEELKEGDNVTACFKDLMAGPNTDNPQMLVEGLWSITFPVEFTVSEDVTIKGTSHMQYAFLGGNATLKEIQLTPLGMTVLSDISHVSSEELGMADTAVAIRLKMLDEGEILVMSHNGQDEWEILSSSSSYSEVDGKLYQSNHYEFKDVLNTEKVAGIYIEDLYVRVK